MYLGLQAVDLADISQVPFTNVLLATLKSTRHTHPVSSGRPGRAAGMPVDGVSRGVSSPFCDLQRPLVVPGAFPLTQMDQLHAVFEAG